MQTLQMHDSMARVSYLSVCYMPMKRIVRVIYIYFHILDINECTSNPCEHSGTCTDEVNFYTCKCPAGNIGAECETSMSEQNIAWITETTPFY